MPLVTTHIPNLVGGVSQQPDAYRFTNQAETQENAIPSMSEGLIKRPPSKHLAKISSDTSQIAHVHIIDRDPTERYVVALRNADVDVWDIDGTSKTIHAPDGLSYLNIGGGSAADDLQAMTVADVTFIWNKETTVEMDSSLSTGYLNASEALIFLKAATATTIWTVTINGVDYSEPASDQSPLNTTGSAIDFAATLHAVSGLTATSEGSVVHVVKTDGTDMAISLSDTNSNTESALIVTEVETTDDLPVVAPNNYIVKVVGQADEHQDDLWLKFETTGGITFGEGKWFETIEPLTKYKFDGTTMPHLLIRRPNGSFLFMKADAVISDTVTIDTSGETLDATSHGFVNGDAIRLTTSGALPGVPAVDTTYYVVNKTANDFQIATTAGGSPLNLTDAGSGTHTATAVTYDTFGWMDRTVGDILTHPEPSFVGEKINDMFFYKNRLGILAGENIILSEAGEFFNFWRITLTTLLDSAPIDIGSSHRAVSIMRHALPFAERLLVISDNAQFILTGQPALTPKTVALEYESSVDSLPDVEPVSALNSAFLAFKRGTNSGVWEYGVPDSDSPVQVDDISSHIPTYLAGDVVQMATIPSAHMLVVQTKTDTNHLYVYNWLDVGQSRVQAAWSKIVLDDDASVLGFGAIEETLYIVVQRTDGIFLESVDFEPGAFDTDTTFLTYLDRRIDNTQFSSAVYTASTNQTVITIPYDLNGETDFTLATRATGSTKAGTVIPVVSSTSTTLTVSGDKSSTPLWFGLDYTMKYKFSTIYLRQAGQGTEATTGIPSLQGRFQLRYGTLLFDDSLFFKVLVTPKHEATPYVYPFAGTFLGTGGQIIGTPTPETGEFRFPVFEQNSTVGIEIQNDSILPSKLSTAEFEANFTTRSRRG